MKNVVSPRRPSRKPTICGTHTRRRPIASSTSQRQPGGMEMLLPPPPPPLPGFPQEGPRAEATVELLALRAWPSRQTPHRTRGPWAARQGGKGGLLSSLLPRPTELFRRPGLLSWKLANGAVWGGRRRTTGANPGGHVAALVWPICRGGEDGRLFSCTEHLLRGRRRVLCHSLGGCLKPKFVTKKSKRRKPLRLSLQC